MRSAAAASGCPSQPQRQHVRPDEHSPIAGEPRSQPRRDLDSAAPAAPGCCVRAATVELAAAPAANSA